MSSEYSHHPVLLSEVVDALACAPGKSIVDATVGSAGHAKEILNCIGPTGRFIGLDRDPQQIQRAREALSAYTSRVMLVCDTYERLPVILATEGIESVDGIFLDLGLSTVHLKDPERGMGFSSGGILDLRFNPEESIPTARERLMHASVDELTNVFRNYGDIRPARAFARAIERARVGHVLERVDDLLPIAVRVLGRSRTHHPLTLVLQALRIWVNDELGALERSLPKLVDCLKPGGRLAIISFHSIEDRIVKHFFQEDSRDCICPPALPLCRCDHHARLTMVNRKPLRAPLAEQRQFPSSRSALLRVAQRI